MMNTSADAASPIHPIHTIQAGKWSIFPGTLSNWIKSQLFIQIISLVGGIGVVLLIIVLVISNLRAGFFEGASDFLTWRLLLLAVLWAAAIVTVPLYLSDRMSSTVIQGQRWRVARQTVTWTLYDLTGTRASRHEHTIARSLVNDNEYWIVAAWGPGTEEYHTDAGERQVYYQSNRTYYRIRLLKKYNINESIDYKAGAELFSSFVKPREWVGVYCVNIIDGALDMIIQFPSGAQVSSIELVRHRLGLRNSQDISQLLSVVKDESVSERPVLAVSLTGVHRRDLYEIWWSWDPREASGVDTDS